MLPVVKESLEQSAGQVSYFAGSRAGVVPARPLKSIRYTASMDLDADIFEQLQRDFAAEVVPSIVAQLLATTESTRVQRCIVFAARGHRWFFDYLCRMAKSDSRDVIATAEYARLDPQLRLYDFGKPIPAARIEEPMAFQDFSKSANE